MSLWSSMRSMIFAVAVLPWMAAQSYAQSNPFLEGIEPMQLSEEEWQELREKSNNTLAQLNVIKQDQEKLPAADGNPIVFLLKKRVVATSYQKRGRLEMLPRIALNQAFEMTYGVPSADGKAIDRPGVFQERSYSEFVRQIFLDMNDLARAFYVDERMALSENYLNNMPILTFIRRRVELTGRWSRHVMTAAEEHRFWLVSVRHLNNLLRLEAALMQNVFAEEILEIEGLKSDPSDLPALRAEWQRITQQIEEKIKNLAGGK